MAKVLKVSRSGYYKFLKSPVCKREEDNQRLIFKIKEAYQKGRGLYGSPRVHGALKKEGIFCSRKRVAKLMRRENLQAKMRKKWKTTTKTAPKASVAPNHLEQRFATREPNRVWVSDISYIATQEGWLYVAIVLELFSRKIVGLQMGSTLETSLATKALKQGLYHRNVLKELLHHSDRGCQYTSQAFQDLAERHHIRLSMSAKGHCYDNAVAESFFHTLKTEHTHLYQFKTREEARNSIFEYIEVFYNRTRLHSTLGYVSPEEYEREAMKSFRKAA